MSSIKINPDSIPDIPILDKIRPFFIGGASGSIATSLTQPIDTVKVQIQIINESNAVAGAQKSSINPIQVAKHIIAQDGIKGFYKGLDAAILRQVTYGTTRLGLFRYLADNYYDTTHLHPSLARKAYYSSLAGFCGCLIGNPADLALVRSQRDSLLPVDQRRNYKNVGDALKRIAKEEGVLSLWKGCIPTICRAISMNIGMLASYDHIKEMINEANGNVQDTPQSQIIASGCAGIICSLMGLPFDNAKTKLQGMKIGPDGKVPYRNIFDCMLKTISQEKVTGLWVGLPTFIMRVSPHAIATLLLQDFFRSLFQSAKKVH